MSPTVEDKAGKSIEVGDQVWTPIRGGRHEGKVEKVVLAEEEAKEYGVKHPPKVVFTDQKGRQVAHNPATLQHAEQQ